MAQATFAGYSLRFIFESESFRTAAPMRVYLVWQRLRTGARRKSTTLYTAIIPPWGSNKKENFSY